MKQTSPLQLIHGGRVTANYLPTHPVRLQILESYLDGRTELTVAANMKIPVDQVRLVLRGWQLIHQRISRAAAMSNPRWQRATEAEISTEVWGELARIRTPPPPAKGLRRAA